MIARFRISSDSDAYDCAECWGCFGGGRARLPRGNAMCLRAGESASRVSGRRHLSYLPPRDLRRPERDPECCPPVSDRQASCLRSLLLRFLARLSGGGGNRFAGHSGGFPALDAACAWLGTLWIDRLPVGDSDLGSVGFGDSDLSRTSEPGPPGCSDRWSDALHEPARALPAGLHPGVYAEPSFVRPQPGV